MSNPSLAPTTRSNAPKEALGHVMNVLKDEKFEKIFKEAGVENIYDFLTIGTNDLKELSYIDNAQVKSLNLVQLGKIDKIKSWFQFQETQDLTTWFTLTEEVLNRYILDFAIT